MVQDESKCTRHPAPTWATSLANTWQIDSKCFFATHRPEPSAESTATVLQRSWKKVALPCSTHLRRKSVGEKM